MAVFRANRDKLEKLFRETANTRWPSTQSNKFYNRLNELWSLRGGGSRFQGLGWERTGSNSNFKQVAAGLVAVLDSNQFERDNVVGAEIDRLAKLENPTRKAFFQRCFVNFSPPSIRY